MRRARATGSNGKLISYEIGNRTGIVEIKHRNFSVGDCVIGSNCNDVSILFSELQTGDGFAAARFDLGDRL